MNVTYNSFDVIIVGAGPAGSACALSLAEAGGRVAIVDKASFPRDKICGDALSADVMAQLPKLSAGLAEKFFSVNSGVAAHGVRLFSPDLTCVDLPFTGRAAVPNGYVMPRLEFDDLLVQQIRASGNCMLMENCAVNDVTVTRDFVEVAAGSYILRARLVVGADGANSVVARLGGRKQISRKHHSAGLRVYYENVDGFQENNQIELYFFRRILPGYLWVFPLGRGRANVGIGMLSSLVSRRKVNLRKTLQELLDTHPLLSRRFQHARPLESMKGHGLPLGSVKRRISGDRYLLVGDAAGLIDPFTGEGIGNAIRSGRVAAEHITKAFAAEDFSATFQRNYDREIYRRMGKELRIGYILQQLCRFPWLFNLVIRKAARSRYWHAFLADAIADIDVKMRFAHPEFYYRLLFK